MNRISSEARVLIVEDSDTKFARLENVLRQIHADAKVWRASTIIDAESKIENESWNLIILDISMDIAKSTAGPKLGGHATLGGLGVAKKMFLLEREAPTIIVTAFDSFEEIATEKVNYDALGLEDVQRRAQGILGEYLRGCVRYGDVGWEERLKGLIIGVSLC